MNILVIGSGGREHALAWKLKQSPRVDMVFCAPGNDGMEGIEKVPLTNFNQLSDFAIEKKIALTVVGPEDPLCQGIVDHFHVRELKIFGPDKKAARLEGSKAFAKNFMRNYQIPTANAANFSDPEAAKQHLKKREFPVVIKADGLAAGKGVRVAMDEDEARQAIENCFHGSLGKAGHTVLIEDYLEGEEISILAFIDHHSIQALIASQDHKRLGEGDTGPNTGGMGAYAPVSIDQSLWQRIHQEILYPVLRGCQKEGFDYRGLLYAGLMLTDEGIHVLEFNVRFGDPETQAILLQMQSDLAEAILMSVDNKLSDYTFSWHDGAGVCVVMSSKGYPGTYEKGHIIHGLDSAERKGAMLFHAGTRKEGVTCRTNGGRVLGVSAFGFTLDHAIQKAYNAVDQIHWEGAYYRRDIAYKALENG